MELSHYMFAGVTLALSVLGFFLKKNKIEIDQMKERMRELEISDARSSERIKTLLKTVEDRRKDVQKIFDKING
jgi:predicted nuclease with TOPRIM domain